jgi:hypothetical protein
MPLARNSAALKRPGSNSNSNLPSMMGVNRFSRKALNKRVCQSRNCGAGNRNCSCNCQNCYRVTRR